jgi:hypothetical protein
MDAKGGAATVAVTAQAECAWTASSQSSWITGLSPTSGQGNAQVQFQVDGNPDPAPRQGDIVFNDQHVQVRQDGTPCVYQIGPGTQTIDADAFTGTIAVTAVASCAWSATTNAPWLSIASGASGSGNGTVTYRAAANASGGRSGTLTVAGQTVTITQNGAASGPPPPTGGPSCTYALDATLREIGTPGGTVSVAVTAGAGCAWTAVSQVPWLNVTNGASGSGNGTVTIAVAENSGASRIGPVGIAGLTFLVNQSGNCAVTVNPTSQSIGAGGGPGAAIGVTTNAGCAWSAMSNAAWLTITNGASGSGNGSVTFSATANPGAARTGTLLVAGQVFTVTQAGSCAATIDPSSQSLPAAGGAGAPVAVTTAGGCAWTAVSNAAWLTITNGASGDGNGTVNFSAAANAGPARSGTVTIAGQTFSVNQAGNCSATLNPTSLSSPVGGGTGSQVAVTVAAGCAWTATSNAPWITITNGASGDGNGAVTFTVAANAGAARSGTLTIASQTFTVDQAGNCSAALNPTSLSSPVGGGTGSQVAVTVAAGCAWTATSNAPWITITNGASGSGNGTVTFTVAANAGAARSGTLTIASQTFTVDQAGNCSATLNPTSLSSPVGGGTGSQVAVTVAAGCAWTATSNAPWITITNGASGSGNGAVTFTVAANAGAARSGTLTIASQTFTVDQAGNCSATLNPTSLSSPVGGGTGNQVAVTVVAGCAWTATSNAPWLTITNGASGNGNGTVTFTVAANTSAARSGTLAIAGQTFTVNQAANCTATINPTSLSIPAGGGAGNQVGVTIAAGCAWTATSNAPWITITNGASGTGNGTVTYTAAANTGGARSGTITIAGQTFTANQAPNCSSPSINPTSQSIPQTGRADNTVSVTVAAGCAWTATNNAPSWITITAGASGNGNGTVTYTVAANTGANRTGTMTIAGITFTVTESGPCNPSLNKTSANFNRNAANADVDVSNGNGCAWTAVSQASWIQITSGSPDTGNGKVRYHVDAFQGPGTSRTGTIIIADLTFTVIQSSQEP